MTEQESRRGKSRRERVEFARSRDILDVANELQMELVRSGRDYRWKEHDSLVISPDKNLWKWFSRNTGGDAISLVETIKEVSFNQSVDFLNDGNFKEFQMVERPQEDFKYYLEKYEQPFSAGRDYLRNQRGLSDETIDYFLEQGVLAQANAKLDYFAEGTGGVTTNAIEPVIVFKSLSSSGEVVGASLQGIQENWEKWPKHGYAKVIMKNSDPMTGIHVDIGSPKRLIFTESPIDLMSYYELHKDSLQDVRLVSMDGLKESTIGRHLSQIQAEISGKPLRWTPEQLADGLQVAIDHHFFEDGKNADLITLALDNDKAGRTFIQELEAKGAVINSDLPELKPGQDKTDWNDALRTQNQQSLVNLSAVSVENEKSFNNPLELVWELHSKWEDELAEKIREDLGINYELQAWQFEKEMSRFITTDLDKLFAKRTRLERDAYFADSTTSIRKEIDRLDAQILEYIEKAPEQSQEKTDWNDALRTQNQQSSVDLSAVSVENEKSFNNPLELVWELHGKWKDELAEKIREDLGINYELQAWQFEKEMSRFITTDLDKLFAKRTRLERDAYFADSTTSIRKEIDRLDAQILEYIEKAPEQSQEKTDWNDVLKNQQEEKSDNSRLAQARRKLERLKGEQDEAISRAYSHQALTNGQPMNDKRGGASFMRKQEQIEGQVFSKMDEIRQQEERVERLEHQQHLKEMGLNRQGSGLEMSVQNIPRIREELEKAKRGESFFTKATLKRYQEELTRLEAISEQMDKTSIQPATQALIDEGLVNQWQKQPNTYFVKGLRRVALELTEEGEFQLSSQTKYHPKTDEERLKVDELLAKQAQGNIGVKPMIQEERSSVPPELFVAFDFTENPNLSQKFSSGDVIPYKDFIAQLYEENNLRMLSLGYDKTYFALQDEKGSRLTDDFRYDIGSEDSDLSTQLGETLPTPYLEQAQKADHDYQSQISAEENVQTESVESEEKAPESSQEQMNDRTSGGTGSLQPKAEGSTSPVLETSTFEQTVTSHPTSSYPYLHFSTNYDKVQRRVGNYHPITPADLRRLNQYAPSIQSTASWYLSEMAGSKISFVYADHGEENVLQVTFQKENFIHLSGIRPFEEGKGAADFLEDFAAGRGHYDGMLISNSIKDKLQVLPMLQDILEPQSFVLDDLSSVEKLHNLNMSEAIKAKDEDFLLLFKDIGDEKIPASLMKLKGELATSVKLLDEKIILGVYRERDGHIEQLSINEEYVKDNGAEMLSVLKNKQFEEVSKEIEQTMLENTLNSPLLDSATFTQVLDTVYNLGVPGDISKTPEEFHQAWNQYLDYAKQHNDKFDQIVAAAGEDNLLDKNSDFYRDWHQDHIYKDDYHIRLQWSEDRPDGPKLPFKETELISYQDFAKELYKANQDFYPIHQEGMKQVTAGNTEGYIPPTKIKFDVYAPGGEMIKEGIRYDIGDETTPISQMLGLGYRRLNGQSVLASMDEEILSQLENREVNKEISQEANESARLTEEGEGQTPDTRETVAFQSSKQETKTNLLQRVEEILKEEPISDLEIPEVNSSSIDYAALTPHELSEVAFQKVREYTETPERLEEYLNFMSKFPELSPRNVALIQEQWPGASAVATYNQWQSMGEVLGITSEQVFETRNTYTNKKTGRTREVVHNNLSVKTGEKSHITLFRPMMVEMIPVLDENGNQVKNGKGNPKYKRLSEATPEEKALKKEGKLKSRFFQERDSNTGLAKFATYKVFELSQTTLKPEFYPKAMPNRHYDFNMDHIRTKEVLEGLSDYAKNIGVTIYQDDAKELRSAKGSFYPDEQKILLNPDNTPGEVVATTIHELAHASLHNPKFANSYKEDVSKDRRELEAEMTSYLVSNHFGLDTSEKAIRYMAIWTDNLTSLDDQQLAQSMKRIHGTVSKIVKSVEQHTKPYQLNRQVGQNQNFIQSPKKGLKV
ncbi:PBECR4 domain-containing protein [Streptococcus oralis]|uniref:PBECR4 domain-containing protein n=1 Tax=Streptococcus oralis TaxID=1303 RepID=UPI002285355E|nr:LPD25 domain-containing protein [Streptococcus oralis]MCY7062042.1 PBECR4 domain-containing protein [Streptococcus oralis]MCY7084198.1 PBECR4 domain-containing protein [Streptococcus oralis]